MLRTLLLIAVLLLPAKSFSAEGVKLRHAASIYADAIGGIIRQPEGIACNDKSLLIAADTGNGRLLPYGFQGGTVKPGAEIKLSELSYPVWVKMNSKGDIFVLDGKKRRILRLSPEGAFKGYLDLPGLPSPVAMVPKSFTIDHDDNIYVLDVFSERVLVLDPEGKYQKQVAFPNEYGFMSDIAVDRKGTIYLIDSVQASVSVAAKGSPGFAPLTKSLRAYMDFPIGITVDGRGTIFITDQNGGGVAVLGQDGAFHGRQLHRGRTAGLVDYPSQLCINDKGEIFVADRNNSRIQIFTTAQ
jgi:sugar lactone lactonase YvrE